MTGSRASGRRAVCAFYSDAEASTGRPARAFASAGRHGQARYSVQLGEYPLGQRATDAIHPREVIDTGRLDAFQTAEMRQQRLAPARADAGDFLQRRRRPRLAAARPVPLDREAVRLVADLLQQVQPRMIGGQVQCLLASRKDDFLEARLALDALGDADQVRRVQSLLGENLG